MKPRCQDPWADAAAELYLEEERAREESEAGDPAAAILELLHPKQRAFVEDDSAIVAALGGRQGGKSFGLAAKGFITALRKPGTTVRYLGLTQAACRASVWPELIAVGQAIGLPLSAYHSATTSVELPHGSQIVAGGTDDRRKIESERGGKPSLVMIDEMGAQDEAWIRYLVQEVVGPSCIRNGGQVVLGGTPGQVQRGYWYEMTAAERRSDVVPVHSWTAWDNPGLGGPERVEAFVSQWLRTSMLTRESAAFRREWLAEWVTDASVLVYPYDEARNGCAALPEATTSGVPIRRDRWRYVIVADPAGVGTTGLAVLACHPELVGVWLVRSEEHEAMLPDELHIRCKALKEVYPSAVVVMDTGGLGSTHALEFTRKFGFAFEAADKSDKRSAIRWVHDMLRCGTLHVVVPDNAVAIRRFREIGWNEARDDHAKGSADHVPDCVVYGCRRLHAYTREDAEATKVRTAADEVAERRALVIRQAQEARERGSRAWRRSR